jgi:hypothetical protein
MLLLFVGSLAGYMTAEQMIDGRGQAVSNTTWRNWQGKPGDPYALAHYLDAGMLPPDRTQWTVYEADRDSQGSSLDADCTYTLKGKLPPLRWWRLAAEGKGGGEGAGERNWLQSDGAIREADESIVISISPTPRPGNWIVAPDVSTLRLMFFLLEARSVPDLPAIERVSCS